MQLLLDAGYAPDAVDRVEDDGAAEILLAGAPLFEQLGVGAKDAERDLQSSWIVFRGGRLPALEGRRATTRLSRWWRASTTTTSCPPT